MPALSPATPICVPMLLQGTRPGYTRALFYTWFMQTAIGACALSPAFCYNKEEMGIYYQKGPVHAAASVKKSANWSSIIRKLN
jgi:hypothetical protein